MFDSESDGGRNFKANCSPTPLSYVLIAWSFKSFYDLNVCNVKYGKEKELWTNGFDICQFILFVSFKKLDFLVGFSWYISMQLFAKLEIRACW
jgi:hypothetical protein